MIESSVDQRIAKVGIMVALLSVTYHELLCLKAAVVLIFEV
jgi:hypothetical protein